MAEKKMYVRGSEEDPMTGKVGLEALDDSDLAEIVQKQLSDGDGFGEKTPGYIAFQELAKRSGWRVG